MPAPTTMMTTTMTHDGQSMIALAHYQMSQKAGTCNGCVGYGSARYARRSKRARGGLRIKIKRIS